MPPPRAYVQPAPHAQYVQPAAAPNYGYNYRPQQPAAPTPAASAVIRPAKFNHSKPLLQQYGTYVMYDVAEVVAARAVDLIRSCRDEYERELMGENK